MPPLGVFRVVGVFAAAGYGAVGASAPPASTPASYPFMTGYWSAANSMGVTRFWPLDESTGTAANEYVAGVTAIYQGSPTYASSLIYASGAHAFTSVSAQYVSTPYNPPGGQTNRTIAVWGGAWSSSTYNALWAYGTSATGRRFESYTYTNNRWLVAANGTYKIGSTDVNDGQTHFFCAVLNGSTMSDVAMYYDGHLEAGTSVFNNIALNTDNNATPFRIGRTQGGGSYMDGTLEGAAVWTSAITAPQVAQLYFSGKRYHYSRQSLAYGAVAFWPLSEQSGTTGYDYVSAVNLTYVNTPTYSSTMIFEGGGHAFSSASLQRASTAWTGAPSGSAHRSFAAWFSTNTPGHQYILSYGSNTVAPNYFYWLVRNTGLQFIGGAGGAYGTYNLHDGVKHFLVATTDGTTNGVRFYVDGAKDAVSSVQTGSTTFNTKTRHFTIGAAFWSPTSNTMNGKLEGISVYNTVLTSAQVSTLYQAAITSTVITSEPAAAWVISYGSLITREGAFAYWNFQNGTLSTGGYSSSVIPVGNTAARLNFLGGGIAAASGLAPGETSTQGVLFASVTDRGYITPANASSIGLVNEFDGGGTFEFMMNAYGSGEAGYGRILFHGDNTLKSGWQMFPVMAAGQAGFALRHYFGGTAQDWYFGTKALAVNSNSVIGSTLHVAVKYNADAVTNDPTLYVNGREIATTVGTNPTGTRDANNADYFRVGNWQSPFDRTYAGIVDEISYYASSLTHAQIAEHAFAANAWYYSQLCMQYGAVRYWALNDVSAVTSTICEEYVAGDDGKYINSRTTTNSLLTEGRSQSLASASNQYVSTNYAGVGGSGNRTICAWISTTATGTQKCICAYGSQTTAKHINFRVNNGHLGMGWYNSSKQGSTNIEDGSSHFVCLTVNGSTDAGVHLWVDGVEETYSFIASGPLNTDNTAEPFLIGRFVTGTGNDFDGKIEGVAFFATALATTQIAALYSAGLA